MWSSNDIQDEFMGQVVLPKTKSEVDDQMTLQLNKKDQNTTGILSLRVITSTQLTSMWLWPPTQSLISEAFFFIHAFKVWLVGLKRSQCWPLILAKASQPGNAGFKL